MVTGIAARPRVTNRPRAGVGLVGLCLVLSACASLTSGTEQTIAVVTAPAVGASCTLRNANGSWHVPRTPGSVTVQRAYGDLAVACAAADGASGDATMTSGVAVATYANILLMGSVVWAAVDAATGAAFAYPDRITVPLKVAAVPVPVATAVSAAAVAVVEDPRSQLQDLHLLRLQHRISAMEYQRRLADLAAASAIATATPVAATASPANGAILAVDDPNSRLRQLRRARAEHNISAMEYQIRLKALIDQGGLSAEALAER